MNDFFDKIYVITCINSEDRQNYIRQHFKNFNIIFEFKSAIDKSLLTDGVISASEKSLILAHQHCMMDAKLNGYNKILICEDDVNFIDSVIIDFYKFIEILPNNWNFIQLGNQFWANQWHRREKIKDNLYRFYEGVGSHCIAINSNIYDKAIEILSKNEKLPPDFLYYDIYKTYTCYSPENYLAEALSKNDHLGRNDSHCKFDSLIYHKVWEDSKRK
jgi:hypothetical protein